MQRVFDTIYTPTSDFVLSASDDGNVRIWKSEASAKLGPIDTRERQSIEYRKKLREKWGNEKGVRNIERYIVLVKAVLAAVARHTDWFGFWVHFENQATTSSFQHQKRSCPQKDNARFQKDQAGEPKATYQRGSYETQGRKTE